MRKYTIKKPNKHFKFTEDTITRGSRKKRLVQDISNNRIAMFKYQEYDCTESCSEKLSFELAKILGYDCAKIELAYDENEVLGILNYMFVDYKEKEHADAVFYINANNEERKKFYTIKNIKRCLDKIDKNLFKDFLKIMVFDAFIGETDRHEENWGILYKAGNYKISPLYDNGCNLLRDFKNEKFMNLFIEGKKDFYKYIKNSKTIICKENGQRYRHFELIKELYKEYEKEVKTEIKKLEDLQDETIENIVARIPNELMTNMHKNYIIKYLLIRKEELLKIIKEKDGE